LHSSLAAEWDAGRPARRSGNILPVDEFEKRHLDLLSSEAGLSGGGGPCYVTEVVVDLFEDARPVFCPPRNAGLFIYTSSRFLAHAEITPRTNRTSPILSRM
jgi:hypothetical protein